MRRNTSGKCQWRRIRVMAFLTQKVTGAVHLQLLFTLIHTTATFNQKLNLYFKTTLQLLNFNVKSRFNFFIVFQWLKFRTSDALKVLRWCVRPEMLKTRRGEIISLTLLSSWTYCHSRCTNGNSHLWRFNFNPHFSCCHCYSYNKLIISYVSTDSSTAFSLYTSADTISTLQLTTCDFWTVYMATDTSTISGASTLIEIPAAPLPVLCVSSFLIHVWFIFDRKHSCLHPVSQKSRTTPGAWNWSS